MKTKQTLIALVLMLNIAYGQQNDTTQLAAKFDEIISEQFKPGESGATVLVARKGEIIYRKAYGMADLELNVPMKIENVFRIGSVTKQFTAIAILQLMEQGKLTVHDKISRFIPDYPAHGSDITIEQLLTHTSGIPEYAGMNDTMQIGRTDLSPVQMIKRFKNLPLRFTPGSKWEYSNSGYFLLGYIIEKVSGLTYAEYISQNIFIPLGMKASLYANDTKLIKNRASGYTAGENGYEKATYLSMSQPYAAGSILSTVDDLYKWQQAVSSYKLVKKETISKAFTKSKLANGTETEYGYGWRVGGVYKSTSLWHGGLINGFMSMTVYLPDEDVFVAILSNCDCKSPLIAANRLAAFAAGRSAGQKEVSVSDKTLQNYIGVYENLKGQQRIITVSENKLFTQLGRGPKSLVRAFEHDKFFYDAEPMSAVEFSRDKTGGVIHLLTVSLRGTDLWKKTSKPLPDENGVKVNEMILQEYVGVYEVSPEFSFTITKEKDMLSLQADGQEKTEMFAENHSTFFLKVNDAQLTFIKDASGKVTGVSLKQGGRETNAKKIK